MAPLQPVLLWVLLCLSFTSMLLPSPATALSPTPDIHPWLRGAPRAARHDASARLTEWPVTLGPDTYDDPRSGCGPRRVNPVRDRSSLGSDGLLCSGPDITHSAGYFKLNRTHDTRMFYFYFESRAAAPAEQPLVLWMTGGPGCSGEIALFFENGPFKINPDNTTLAWNPFGWDLVSNIIYVDQPVGTGFSYSKDPRDVRHDENGVSQDVYEFLQAFLGVHPELRDRPFFVTGESYGGHYVPAVAHRILTENKGSGRALINLQGLAVGNGLTHPVVQYRAYPDFSLLNNLLTPAQHKTLVAEFLPCKLAATLCGQKGRVSCYSAFVVCNVYYQAVYVQTGDGHLNQYDIREDCMVDGLCYDLSAANKFLGQASVRSAMGIPDFVEWQACSREVGSAMVIDFERDIEPQVQDLLEAGMRVLIYAGEKDFICNWLGNWRWVKAMDWSGHAAFLSAPRRKFTNASSGAVWGEAVESNPLSFLKVFNTGHMVPMNQPEAALEMLLRFTRNLPLGSSNETLPTAGWGEVGASALTHLELASAKATAAL